MKRYLKIRDSFYLVQEEVNTNPVSDAPIATNHIFIYDRSDSMYYLLPQLVEDLIVRCKQIPTGDTISIGWFATEGKFNFILKGFKISNSSDYTILENAVRNNNKTLGLTCFSEILHETADKVINDLSVFSDRFALTFFTDGYPVVKNYRSELENIFSAISKLEKTITASLLVGYGNYYNKELMLKMAENLGGSLVHSSNLQSFNITLNDFIESVKSTDNKIKVKVIENKINAYFSINEGNINLYAPNDNYINFVPVRKGKNYLYCLTNIEPKDSEEILLTDGQVGKNTKIEAFVKGVYAAAYICIQRTKVADALDILGLLGDKYVIDSISNAFTIDEYGKAELLVADCVKSPNKRFVKGRNINYLPAKDAFCVLDLIELLQNDETAYFYPRHPEFKYNRIGLPAVPKSGYPEFVADDNIKCKITSTVWNNSRLNLSIRLKLDGTVKLKKDYKKVGFTNNVFQTFVWRHYTLIKDGFLNVTTLPISVSPFTFKILKMKGLLKESDNYSDKVFIIDLTRLPIINRQIAEESTSAKELFNLSFKSLQQKAYLKTYKYFRKELCPEKTISVFDGLTNNQVEYLANLGITDKGYSPPTEYMVSTDVYHAKEFEINIKKFKSLSKIPDVLKKLYSGKPLTVSEELIKIPLLIFNTMDKDQDKIGWLDNQINELTKKNRETDHKIQKIKFATILGNQWFEEFNSWDENSMKIGDVEFEIKFSTKEIKI